MPKAPNQDDILSDVVINGVEYGGDAKQTEADDMLIILTSETRP